MAKQRVKRKAKDTGNSKIVKSVSLNTVSDQDILDFLDTQDEQGVNFSEFSRVAFRFYMEHHGATGGRPEQILESAVAQINAVIGSLAGQQLGAISQPERARPASPAPAEKAAKPVATQPPTMPPTQAPTEPPTLAPTPAPTQMELTPAEPAPTKKPVPAPPPPQPTIQVDGGMDDWDDDDEGEENVQEANAQVMQGIFDQIEDYKD